MKEYSSLSFENGRNILPWGNILPFGVVGKNILPHFTKGEVGKTKLPLRGRGEEFTSPLHIRIFFPLGEKGKNIVYLNILNIGTGRIFSLGEKGKIILCPKGNILPLKEQKEGNTILLKRKWIKRFSRLSIISFTERGGGKNILPLRGKVEKCRPS